ncbi:MAG: Uncharacterised protein [Cyanobium sp. ARS6]|nr:MAG: Uncharacterised protein [Cyanobium sp. ARS6]
MRGVTLQCQLSEPHVEGEIPSELNRLQLFQLATEESLEDHQTKSRTSESQASPSQQSNETLLPGTGRHRQQP